MNGNVPHLQFINVESCLASSISRFMHIIELLWKIILNFEACSNQIKTAFTTTMVSSFAITKREDVIRKIKTLQF